MFGFRDAAAYMTSSKPLLIGYVESPGTALLETTAKAAGGKNIKTKTKDPILSSLVTLILYHGIIFRISEYVISKARASKIRKPI